MRRVELSSVEGGEALARILQLTDTHLFAEPGGLLGGVDVDTSLAAVIEHAVSAHPQAELVLATGDLVHEETAPSYERLAGYLARLQLPVYCLPGNHEDKGLLAERCRHSPHLRYDKEVTIGDWRILLLDSAQPPEPGGYLPEAELAFLEQALAADPDRPTLVALHHPPVSIDSPWMDAMRVANAGELFAVLDRYREVRAVVFGHIHQHFETTWAGVRYLGTPSTGLQFRPGATQSAYDSRPPGYRWLELGPDGALETGVDRLAEPVA